MVEAGTFAASIFRIQNKYGLFIVITWENIMFRVTGKQTFNTTLSKGSRSPFYKCRETLSFNPKAGWGEMVHLTKITKIKLQSGELSGSVESKECVVIWASFRTEFSTCFETFRVKHMKWLRLDAAAEFSAYWPSCGRFLWNSSEEASTRQTRSKNKVGTKILKRLSRSSILDYSSRWCKVGKPTPQSRFC